MGLPVTNPTYLLAPNWTFRPDGPVQLGTIVSNPLKPHIALKKRDASHTTEPDQPYVTVVTEKNWKLTDEGKRSVSASLWATFLESVQLKIGGNHSKRDKVEFSAEALETRYYRDGVPPDIVLATANDPIIKALMKPNSLFARPVFMITGVKIARTLTVSTETERQMGMNFSGSAPTGGPASVGGELKADTSKLRTNGFDAEDVVFAYQLLKIAPKGWGKKRSVQGKEYQSKAAFLSSGDGNAGDRLEIETSDFEPADLEDVGLDAAAVAVEQTLPSTDVGGDAEVRVIHAKAEPQPA